VRPTNRNRRVENACLRPLHRFEGLQLRYAPGANKYVILACVQVSPRCGAGGFAPRWGWGPNALRPGWAQGAAHCAPVGGGAKPTAPRLGVGVIFLIPSGGSYQNFCPSYCRVPRVPGVPGSPVAGLAWHTSRQTLACICNAQSVEAWGVPIAAGGPGSRTYRCIDMQTDLMLDTCRCALWVLRCSITST